MLGRQLGLGALGGAQHRPLAVGWAAMEGKAAQAVAFGLVHRDIRPANQCVGVQAVFGVEADADAGAQRHQPVAHQGRHRQRGGQFLGHPGGVVGLADLSQQNHKLVAAIAADRVDGAHRGDQHAGHPQQHGIAHRMALAVVDLLEMVDVEKQQCQPTVVALGGGQRPVEAVVQQAPAGQMGQGVQLGRLQRLVKRQCDSNRLTLAAQGRDDQLLVDLQQHGGLRGIQRRDRPHRVLQQLRQQLARFFNFELQTGEICSRLGGGAGGRGRRGGGGSVAHGRGKARFDQPAWPSL